MLSNHKPIDNVAKLANLVFIGILGSVQIVFSTSNVKFTLPVETLACQFARNSQSIHSWARSSFPGFPATEIPTTHQRRHPPSHRSIPTTIYYKFIYIYMFCWFSLMHVVCLCRAVADSAPKSSDRDVAFLLNNFVCVFFLYENIGGMLARIYLRKTWRRTCILPAPHFMNVSSNFLRASRPEEAPALDQLLFAFTIETYIRFDDPSNTDTNILYP